MKKLLSFLLCLLLLFPLAACSRTAAKERAAVWTTYESDTVYLATLNGSALALGEGVSRAALAPNREKACFLQTKDCTVGCYVQDLRSGARETVYAATKGKAEITLGRVTDTGVLFEVATQDTDKLYVYDFDSKKTVFELGLKSFEGGAVTTDANSLTLAFVAAGGLYVLPDGKSSAKQIYNVGSLPTVVRYVSADGKTVVFTLTMSAITILYLYRDGTVTQIGDASGSAAVSVNVSADGKTVAVLYNKMVYLLYKGKEVATLECPDKNADLAAAGTDRQALATDTKSVKGVYFTMGNVLYYLGKNTAAAVLENVANFLVRDGKLFYSDTSGTLYAAKIKKGAVSDNVKLCDNSDKCMPAADGKYLYFTDTADTLFVHTFGGKTKQVAEGVRDFFVTVGGDEVFYTSDMRTDIPVFGTLTRYSAKTGTATTVDPDVFAATTESGHRNGYIDPTCFEYKVYTGNTDALGNFLFHVKFYNGSEPTTVLENVGY